MTIFRTIVALIAAALFTTACYRPSPAPAQANVSSTGAATPKPSDDGEGDLSQETTKAADQAASEVVPVLSDAPQYTAPNLAESVAGQGPGRTVNVPNQFAISQTQPAHDPLPAPARVNAPAVPSGRYELRSVKVGFRQWQNQWVWVSNQPAYQPRQQTFGGCASGQCGRR